MSEIIARKNATFTAICLTPDVCKTPVGPSVVPVPYPIICFFGGADATAQKVFANKKEVILHKLSLGPSVTGDEPGTLGGVVSQVNRGKVWTSQHAPKVYIEGLQVVRHDDMCEMNVAG